MSKTICVVGLWHQASVLAACLANMGHHVWGVGEDEQAVARLSAAQPPVFEPRLKSIMRRNLRDGRLRYTTDYGEALRHADLAYVAIDTPVGPDDESDLSSIFEAARNIGRHMAGDLVLCVSAQVPVGTCELLGEAVREQAPQWTVEVVYVPEFLQLGRAVDTFLRPNRVVIGAEKRLTAERVAELYEPLKRPIFITSLRTAEMAKHASNAFLAASISFINEVASLCDEVGSDVLEVAQVMKHDRRIGRYAYLSPGLGFAGGTLGREVRALQKLGREHRCPILLMDAVMAVNLSRLNLVVQRLRRIYNDVAGLRFGLLGLTYKAGTSTLRRATSLEIIGDLVAAGATVAAYDPLARLEEVTDLPPFETCADPYAAASGSDAVVLLMEWEGMESLDLARLRQMMRRPVFIDTRNHFDPAKMAAAGFIFSAIGRGLGIERVLT